MSKRRNTIIVWIAIYPAITLLSYAIGGELNNLPVYLRTLILTGILVPLMVYFLIPFWAKVLQKVPSKKQLKAKKQTNT